MAEDLVAGGLPRPAAFVTLDETSRASARDVAIAYCQGTPLPTEIEARGALPEATERARRALTARFGDGLIAGRIRAHVVLASQVSTVIFRGV